MMVVKINLLSFTDHTDKTAAGERDTSDVFKQDDLSFKAAMKKTRGFL